MIDHMFSAPMRITENATSSIARNRSDSGHGYGLSEIDTISQRLAGQSLNEGANRVLADDDVLEVRNKREL